MMRPAILGTVVSVLGMMYGAPGKGFAQHRGGHHSGGHHGGHGFGHGGHHGFGHGFGHGLGHGFGHSVGHGLGHGLGHGHHGHHRAHHFGHYGFGLYFGYGYYDPYYYPYYGWYGRPGYSLYYYGPYGYPSYTYTSVYIHEDKNAGYADRDPRPRSRPSSGPGGDRASFPEGVAVPRPLVEPEKAPEVLPLEGDEQSSGGSEDRKHRGNANETGPGPTEKRGPI